MCCNSTFSIICHSQRIKLCGAPGARGGWHAPCLVARRSRSTDPQPPRPPNTEKERASEHERVGESGINRAPWPISSHDDVGAGHELHSAAHGQTICSRKTGYVRLMHERRSGVQCPRRLNLRHVQGTLPIPVNDSLTVEPGEATGNR